MWFWGIVLLLVVVLGVLAVLVLLPYYREKRFVARLQSEDGQSPEKVLEESRRRLRDKMLEAIGTLQGSPHLHKHGGTPLYVLPWYLMLGASQSGKTALLHGVANQSTPFGRPASATAGTPTDNCDWWFFNTAIVLDTSSRYAFPTQVGHDSAEWYRLLQLLKHYRPQQPLNGLLLAVAADTLATQAPETLRLAALELRKRVDETVRELGVEAPVYLLVTRCDLLEGFTEFFGCLPEQTFQHGFGVMLETASHNGQQQPQPGSAWQFAPRFTEVITRLQQLRLTLYNQEKLPPAALRQKVFCFPEEFAALQAPLSTFVETLFADNPVQHTPCFRGLFFCSARQHGAPVSLVRRRFAFEAPGQPLEAGNTPYFLHDLFAVLLPRDRFLVKSTVAARRGWFLKHLFGFVGSLALGLLLVVLLSWAFFSDRQAYAAADEALCDVATPGLATPARLAQADGCRQAVQALIDRNHRRPSWSKFLFHRSTQLEARLRQRYVEKFAGEILAPLDTALEQRLASGTDPVSLVFVLFKRLDLLARCLSEAGCPPPIQAEQQPDYALMLSAVWPQPVLPEHGARLGHAYTAYLHWLAEGQAPLRQEQAALVKRLQHWFASGQLALQQMLRWADQHYPPVTAQAYWEAPASAGGDSVEVTGAYTRAAWEQSLLPLLRHAPEIVPELRPRLEEFVTTYRTQAFEQWQRFLAAFPRGESGWAGARAQRRQLALKLLEAHSPYHRLLAAAVENLRPLLPQDAEASSAAAAQGPSGMPAWAHLLHRYAESESRKAYLEALKEAGKHLTGEVTGEASFQLARAGFQEGKATEKSTHPLLRAWWSVEQFRAQEGAGDAAAEEAFWPLLRRPLLFVWQVLLEEAGLYMQERWNELLLEVKDLPVGQKHEVLYGKAGKVAAFVNGPAVAFLERRGEDYLRKRCAEAEVAFTEPFLLYLKRARVGWVQPEFDEAKRRISVSVAPADLQADGDVKVAKTELMLDCDTGRQVLSTPNTGGEYAFVWTAKSCFQTTVRASLVDAAGQELASLGRRYPGFLQFLEHFSSGQQVLRPADVTVESSGAFAPAQIRALTLRYRVSPPDARQQILKDLEAYKRYEDNLRARLELPARIVAASH